MEYGSGEKGLELSPEKTTLLCITAARSYAAITFINLGSEDIMISKNSMKLLGFDFDNSLSPLDDVKASFKKLLLLISVL